MSQSTSLSNRDVHSIALSKYSFADGQPSRTSRFTEVFGPNLYLVFDKVQYAYDARQRTRLRVVSGTQDLEIVDVQGLVEASTIARRSQAVTSDQLPIFAFWRASSIALQVQLPGRDLRRIQLRFHDQTQREQVVVFLDNLGMQIQEKTDRPNTATSVRSYRSNHSVTVPRSNERDQPISHSQRALLGHQNHQPITYSTWNQDLDALQMPPPSRSSAVGDDYVRPLTSNMDMSMIGVDTGREVSAQNSMAKLGTYPVDSIRDKFPPRELPFQRSDERPSSRPGSSRPRSSASDLSPLPKPTPLARDAAQATDASNQTEHNSVAPSSRTASSYYRAPITNPTGNSRLAPSTSGRTLRPRNKTSGADNTSLFSDAARTLDPIKSSSTIQEGPLDSSSRPASSSHIPTTALTSRSVNIPPFTNRSVDINRNINSDDSSHGRDDISNSKPPIPRPLFDVLDAHGGFISDPSENAQSRERHEQLAAWAQQSPEDRMAALDNYFVSKLEDENFVRLVEDVDVCWRRVGLGL